MKEKWEGAATGVAADIRARVLAPCLFFVPAVFVSWRMLEGIIK